MNSVDELTNGRGELWDFYFKMSVIEFLNRLAFYKAKGVYQRQNKNK